MATTLGKAALNAEVTKQAAVVAYANDFKLMMVVALVALPLIFLLKRAKVQPGGGGGPGIGLPQEKGQTFCGRIDSTIVNREPA